MRILITGGSGALGQYLNCYLSRHNEILTLYHTKPGNCLHFNAAKVDINDAHRMHDIFAMFRPEAVIHTAAISTPLLQPGTAPADVYRTNVTAVKTIAELCNHSHSGLIYFSTDLVYDGYRGSFLKEDAKLIPASLYAETKLVAEAKVREAAEKYIILRSSLLFGFGLNRAENFFNQMYRNFSEKKPVRLFRDQYRSPLSLHAAARMMENIIEIMPLGATLNFGGSERLSRADLGRTLCQEAGFEESLIEEISMDEMPELPRVEDVSLDLSRLNSLGIHPPTVDESMKEILAKMKDFCPDEVS